MNSEMFLCKIADFLKDYGPVQVPKEDVKMSKKPLVSANVLGYSRGVYTFSKYQRPSSPREDDEAMSFEVSLIVEAIFDYANSASKRGNIFTPKSVPANQYATRIAGTHHKIHVCIVQDEDRIGDSPNNNIIVGKGLAKDGSWNDQITIREQLVGDCNYILYNDPRRMFIYGITTEGRWISMWYLSRSHSVKSISFDWVSEEIDQFIEIYLAIAFATPAELGVDPLVHKAPVFPRSTDPSEQTQQYIYECRPQLDHANSSAAGRTRYYKTVHSLISERPYGISGRMTRIWQAIEVDSIHNAERIPGTEPVILKDVWLDVTRKTEAENMDLIFEAVDKFVADARDRYPGPHGLKHFMDEEPRFEYFDQRTKTRLEHLLTDKQYRSLFLTKRHAWKGEMTKKNSKSVRRPHDSIFISRIRAKKSDKHVGEAPRTVFSHDTTSMDDKASVEEEFGQLSVSADLPGSAFVQTQQSRFVYEEVCSRLWDLPALGDLVDILRQALDALEVLWCAGWVHRDVSSGNILAFPIASGNGTRLKVKLADLEFAQPLNHPTQRSDPRIGTPYFMPFEILDRSYLFRGLYSPTTIKNKFEDSFADQLNLPGGETDPNYQRFANFIYFYGKRFKALPDNATVHIPPEGAVVSYNYQHDLESLWWVVLYCIPAAVGHSPSFRYAATIFTEGLKLTVERMKAFQTDIHCPLRRVLCPSLQAAFPKPMATLLSELYINYGARALFGQLKLPESYSQIHAIFATEFDKLLDSNDGNWKQTEIVSLNPKEGSCKRALENTVALGDGPECAKRRRVEE